MIPAELNTEDLASQLAGDGIAFETQNPANPALEAHLADTVGSLGSSDLGIAVLETTPQQLADLRDVAQVLHDATGYETVIVRAPGGVGAVSGDLPRAAVESGQRALLAEPDYGAGVRAFVEAAEAQSVQWVPAGAGSLVLLALVGALAWFMTRGGVK